MGNTIIKAPLRVILAQPRGFCAGVERAVETVERALTLNGPPVYVHHEIVHNKRVVDDLKKRGAVFVESISDIPKGALTIYSAHGVSRHVETQAQKRHLSVIDATCPLVARVHHEGRRHAANGATIILIGHKGHAEVKGTVGQIDGPVHIVENTDDAERLRVRDPDNLAYITQTTLSVDDTRDIITILTRRFPAIKGPDINNICYATQNRQQAVRMMADKIDLLLVLGAANSSNSNRLREIAEDMGVRAYLISDAEELKQHWLDGVDTLGITAGASAPAVLVDELITRLHTISELDVVNHQGIVETVQFKLPTGLRDSA